MCVILPKRFEDKLLPDIESIIRNSSTNRGNTLLSYLETSPYYFKEYTMHGLRHIESVLNYADKLIPQDQYEKMSKLDISILVLGIFLHDLGMFIKESGLKHLLQRDVREIYDKRSGSNYTWKELWGKYIGELKRAPGKELDEIFGEEEHVFDMTSYPVCAGFIRKYHHQIAYHIAVYGFPGEKSHDLLCRIEDKDVVKLVGLLAKSHGMALRELNDEIDAFGYDNNLPLNVPIYYLMSILRLADLLDADDKRAPRILSDMNNFSSLRSEKEWTLNQLIRGRQWSHENGKPDTLKMIAFPENSKQYLELKSWFEYWQKELDLSWAIIGEMHRDNCKLSIRRITSNIYDANYDFVTNAIELKVNPDIVKLLVAPLYGDDPSYGVRELLQNAIDACNERTAIDGTPGEIVVDVNEKTGLFTISDNGVGMNEDVISNYYLNAGASYRYSKQWAETFSDDENNSKIARNGRFGIGALATFLIGSKAKIVTRNINDVKGYCFEYTIEPKLLNVGKVKKPTPGTTIEIAMNQKAKNKFIKPYWFDWTQWYHFTTPNITYRLNGKELSKDRIFNLKKGEDSDNWFYCQSKDYDSLHWSVSNYVNSQYLCNGIHIPNGHDYYRNNSLKASLEKRGYFHESPYISIVDKKGIFPLDLARKTVFDTFTLDDNVVAELCKYQIAKVLVYGHTSQCIINKNGFIPRERSFVLNIERPVYLVGKSRFTFEVVENIKGYDVAVGFFTADRKLYANNIKDQVLGDDLAYRLIVTEIWANSMAIDIPRTVGYLPARNKIHSFDNYIEGEKNLPIPSELIGENVNLIVKYSPSPLRNGENNIMLGIVKEMLPKQINGGWIPFDEKERERLYFDTYKKLERYIEPLKAEKKQKERR